MSKLTRLLREVRACEICRPHLPLGPRPILTAHSESRVLIIGQAPGSAVHKSGVPWDDPSGKRLRDWMGVTSKQFYDPRLVAFVPMGFCYPGKGSGGDLPPRPECAETWHEKVLDLLPSVELTILLSRHALARYLAGTEKKTLTETVRAWKEYGPSLIPLPHPSPRNNIWLKKNPWFESEVLPTLRSRVSTALK